MTKKIATCFLISLAFVSSPLFAKNKGKDAKIWDLGILRKMNFAGGVEGALKNKEAPFYRQLYVFGDHLSDSGNLLGMRFLPNQWPLPIGEGVNFYGEPLSIVFTHQIPWPIFQNKSFPTAHMAKGPLNIADRINQFLDPGILGGYGHKFNQNTIFVAWGGFNDAISALPVGLWDPSHYRPDFKDDADIYVKALKRISDLEGDIIFMNVPDTVTFPGGRLSGRTGVIPSTLRALSLFLHLDFNQSQSAHYLSYLHRGEGLTGIEALIKQDLIDFKAAHPWLNSERVDAYAAAYYQMQWNAVNQINADLNQALINTIHKENIIYADVRRFINEMVRAPTYQEQGFDNVLSPECGSFSAANACHTNPQDKGRNYLFGDGFSLSFKGQKEVFSYLSMLIASPFVLAGIYNSFLSTNIDMNLDLVNGYTVKAGNYAAKPVLNLLYNREWQLGDEWPLGNRITYGFNLGFKTMNYRLPFTDLWAATSYIAPYANLKIFDWLTVGVENQTSESYYEARREVTFEGRIPMSAKDRYEKANLSAEKFLFVGSARLHYDDDIIHTDVRGLFGPGYLINHRYEDRTNTSTSMSFAPNNLFYLHGEIKFNLEFKKFPADDLNLGLEGVGHYNQALTKLALVGNTKYAPVKFRRKIKLITNYEGDWLIYFKKKIGKQSDLKFGYEGRNYNYIIRQGVFLKYQHRFE